MIPSMTTDAGGYLYNFTDQTKTDGDRYYHLKIIDRDGNFTYTQVVFVGSTQKGTLAVMPTMVSSSINVFLPALGQAAIAIFNTSGQIVKTLVTGSETFNIDVSGLGRGEYFLNAVQSNQSYTTKFLKQ